jgi:amidase
MTSIAKDNNFSLTREELHVFTRHIEGMLESYDRLDKLAKNQSHRPIRNLTGRAPSKKENPFGAWAWKCSIKASSSKGGLSSRKLQGKRIAIKDSVLVAGVPLRNGSSMLRNFVPSVDATIVTRILQNGGEIVGKSTCEDLCTSGGSHTSYPQPVRNPHNQKYMAGGSSSGSAALLAAGEVDMAIGGDQAGSIRIPSSWCGVYGLKPTFGLVPYSGILGMEPVLDHVGPMASNVRDLALLLEVMAGRDGHDPRQLKTPEILPSYLTELRKAQSDGKRKKVNIALIKEGFGWPKVSESDVDSCVRDSAYKLEEVGARVREISLPMHRDAIHIWAALCQDGLWNYVVRNRGIEHLWNGMFDVNLIQEWSRALRTRGDQLSETAKLTGIVGNYVATKWNGKYYALAHNLRHNLIRKYSRVLEEYDVLALPTTPQKAQPLKTGWSKKNEKNLEWSISASMSNLHNTCAFDVSGHPALNIPCGFVSGLPVGMMLVGRHYDEGTLLSTAERFEKLKERG